MKIYLEEKIGNPELFTGRKREMSYLLNWINRIKREISKSTAILSRRKTGKTAILQRLYNLTFEKNNGVIPFYYEVKEGKLWAVDFCQDFYLSFMFQYIAFKTRDPKYMALSQRAIKRFADAKRGAEKVGDYLIQHVIDMEELMQEKRIGLIWAAARDTPWTLAAQQDERIVQFIDEFQFLNSEIYWDEAKTNQADDFAAGYMSTAEYRNAPLLISGSWVGWLMQDLQSMLPGRFSIWYLEDMPEGEALEMIYRYSLLENIPVTAETAYLLAGLTEGNPFYISALMRSKYSAKDLTSEEGVLCTLEFETLNRKGEIRGTWLEYIDSALPRINEKYAKEIVLYLSQDRKRFISRQKLKRELQLDMSDSELRKKLKALLRCDIIEENYFKYRGVQDNIFDKIFRSEYGEDIDEFVPAGARHEYQALFEELTQKYNRLSGEYNRYKGAFAEFMIIQHLLRAYQNPALYHALLQNLPPDFEFIPYARVWAYYSPPLHQPQFQIDVFAQGTIALIGEVKHRQKKFSLPEAREFAHKAAELMRLEGVARYQLFVFSSGGFRPDVLDYFRAQSIAWSADRRWLAKLENDKQKNDEW